MRARIHVGGGGCVDERKVQEAIGFLEEEVPRERARVKLDQYGGGPDESQIIANKDGFLRLGVEFLKAAYAPVTDPKDPTAVKVDIDYLLTGDSSIYFGWIQRREPDDEPGTIPGRFIRFIPWVILSVLVGIAILALVGLIVTLRWITA